MLQFLKKNKKSQGFAALWQDFLTALILCELREQPCSSTARSLHFPVGCRQSRVICWAPLVSLQPSWKAQSPCWSQARAGVKVRAVGLAGAPCPIPLSLWGRWGSKPECLKLVLWLVVSLQEQATIFQLRLYILLARNFSLASNADKPWVAFLNWYGTVLLVWYMLSERYSANWANFH